jgi:hypothetical protein
MLSPLGADRELAGGRPRASGRLFRFQQLLEHPQRKVIMSVTLDTVKRYAPVVHFHENEQYFPCSVEHVLHNSVLKDRDESSWHFPNPTQATLQQYHSSNYYVAINPTQFAGMGVTAPMYYAVQEYSDAVEISYVMLYAYQGGQTCRALRAGTEFNCIVKTLGIHQGDLERVVVTLVPRKQGQYLALRVGYEVHGDLNYFPTQRVAWEGSHPIVNIALNGHSSHNMFSEGDRVTEFEQPGSVAIISALSQTGLVWRPSTDNQFKQLGLDSKGKPVGDQVWVAFHGRLGDSQDNRLESATYFDGSNLSSLDWSFVKLTDWAAKLFDKYPEDIIHGKGAPGPGGRAWVTPSSGKLFDRGLMKLQAVDHLGQGPAAVKWFAGSVASVARREVVQCWGKSYPLGMTMYGTDDNNQLQQLWISEDMGEGPGAVAWLMGNFIGDQRKEIVQCWGDSGLGMIMYGTNGSSTGVTRLWSNESMGQGSGAVAWCVGDFNGDGKDEIVQCWGSDTLGMIIYGSDGRGGLTTLWINEDMGQGPGAVAWLVGDFNNDGKDEIVQCWGSDTLGMIMYGSDDGGGLKQLWINEDMGEGPGAVAWLVGNFAGDGKDAIVQCWGKAGLGMIMYGSDGLGGLRRIWSNESIGEGSGAVAWLVGNFVGDGKDEIVQCWGNSGLGMIMYGSDGGGGLKKIWSKESMREGSGAVAWLVGNFFGADKDEIIQCWGSDELGMIMYGTV